MARWSFIRLLVLLVALANIATPQGGAGSSIVPSTTDPSGTCSGPLPWRYIQSTGHYCACVGTTWTCATITSGGGISSPLTTKGDVWGYSTVNARVPVGANDFCFVADSAQALGVKWAACPGVSLTGTTSQIPYISTTNAALTGATGFFWNSALARIQVNPGGLVTIPTSIVPMFTTDTVWIYQNESYPAHTYYSPGNTSGGGVNNFYFGSQGTAAAPSASVVGEGHANYYFGYTGSGTLLSAFDAGSGSKWITALYGGIVQTTSPLSGFINGQTLKDEVYQGEFTYDANGDFWIGGDPLGGTGGFDNPGSSRLIVKSGTVQSTVNLTEWRDTGTTVLSAIQSTGSLLNVSVVFASLGTPSNGTQIYCSDCTVTSGSDNTCAASGTGALAIRANSVWRCQ